MSFIQDMMARAKEMLTGVAQDAIQDTVENVKDSVLGGGKKSTKRSAKKRSSSKQQGADLGNIGDMIDGARQTIDGLTQKKRK